MDASSPPLAAVKTNHNSQLLDLADLDGYLLSLLSVDLFDVLRHAVLAKDSISKVVRKKSNNDESIRRREEESMVSVSSSSSKRGGVWWQWEDVLAFFTIWASHGQTPGARALGLDLTAQRTQQTKNSRRSLFWRWIAAATRSNNNTSAILWFRYKILLYAFLRVILPRLYERIKSKGLEYANSSDCIDGDAAETEEDPQPISLRLQTISSPLPGNSRQDVRALAMQRRKFVVRTFLQWLDGAILPSVRLALLLSCWGRSDSGHGGNFALWASGLSYKHSNVATPAKTTTIPLFVLYAHRRWFQREAIELLWNRIGRCLLVVHRETTELGASLSALLATEWRMLIVRWSYKLDKFKAVVPRAILQESSSNSRSSQSETCALCGTDKIVVPYRLTECCGKLACYVCLWERLASTITLRSGSSERVSCPVCHQDISKCEPV